MGQTAARRYTKPTRKGAKKNSASVERRAPRSPRRKASDSTEFATVLTTSSASPLITATCKYIQHTCKSWLTWRQVMRPSVGDRSGLKLYGNMQRR